MKFLINGDVKDDMCEPQKVSQKRFHLHSSVCGFWEGQMAYVASLLFDSYINISFFAVKKKKMSTKKTVTERLKNQSTYVASHFSASYPTKSFSHYHIFLHCDLKNIIFEKTLSCLAQTQLIICKQTTKSQKAIKTYTMSWSR